MIINPKKIIMKKILIYFILLAIMAGFHSCEKYELGNNINSKVLAFAFGLSAEIERNLIFFMKQN